jgi:peptidyl-prolyl cis-trans isomerase C
MPLSMKGDLVPRNSIGRSARRLAPAAALLALVALAGCRDDANVLARVEDQPITVAQFNDVARAAGRQYPGPADSARSRLLADMVQRELLVQGARREHMDDTPEFMAYRDALTRQILRETYFRRAAGGPFPVSEAEARALYERRKLGTHVHLIYAYNADMAKAAARAIARGEPFATVADRYNPTGMVPAGGDVGTVQAGALMPPLDEIVRTGPLGQVLGPIEVSGQGWFLLLLQDRKPVNEPAYEQERDQLMEVLRQRKQRVTALKVIENLRGLYQVRVAPGAPQRMVGQFRPRPDVTGVPAPIGPARDEVLATFVGGRYTLGDAYDDLMGDANSRPNLDVTPAVERWIEGQALNRAALAEAMKNHLQDEPEIRDRLRDRLDNFLLDGYYNRQVAQRIDVSPADFAAAYERYKASFTRLSEARVQTVTLKDSAAAATLAAAAGQAPSLRDAATAAGAGARVQEEMLTFPNTSDWAAFEGKLSTMHPGEIAGPYATPNGWRIVQMIQTTMAAPPLESLPPGTQQQLQNVATESKREARLAALTDSLRRVIRPVVVYADRLQRVPWPPAPATTGS